MFMHEWKTFPSSNRFCHIPTTSRYGQVLLLPGGTMPLKFDVIRLEQQSSKRKKSNQTWSGNFMRLSYILSVFVTTVKHDVQGQR